MTVLGGPVYTCRTKRPLPSSSDTAASRPRSRRTLDPHTPIQTRRNRLVLPTKQRICLIRQKTSQNRRLNARSARLCWNILYELSVKTPQPALYVLDCRVVHIFLPLISVVTISNDTNSSDIRMPLLEHSMIESLRNPYRDVAAHSVCFHLVVYQYFSTVTFAVESDLLPFEKRWTRLVTQVAASSNEMCKRLQATRLMKADNAIMRGNPMSDF